MVVIRGVGERKCSLLIVDGIVRLEVGGKYMKRRSLAEERDRLID